MQPSQLIEIYNCLCDETRLRIVHLLTQSPLCVCHLQDILGLDAGRGLEAPGVFAPARTGGVAAA